MNGVVFQTSVSTMMPIEPHRSPSRSCSVSTKPDSGENAYRHAKAATTVTIP